MPRVTDDLIWVAELEMAIEYQGSWKTQVLPPAPFTALSAECEDAPLWLEIYALDPDEFRHIDSVGRDLVHSRLSKLTHERYEPTPRGLDVSALGVERGRPTELTAAITFDNDAFYVVAFSAAPGVMEGQQWRVQAMLASTTFGRHGSYGTGFEGLLNMMGAHLAESQVIMGQSRAQLGLLRRFERSAPPPEVAQRAQQSLKPSLEGDVDWRGDDEDLLTVQGPPSGGPPPPDKAPRRRGFFKWRKSRRGRGDAGEARGALADGLEAQDVGAFAHLDSPGDGDGVSDRSSESPKVVVAPELLERNGHKPTEQGGDGAQSRGSSGDQRALDAFEASLKPQDDGSSAHALRSVADRDELADFEARLRESAPVVQSPVDTGPRWPSPWEALPNVQPQLQMRVRPEAPMALTARASVERRAQAIFAFADSLPARVSFHAEKVFGVGESLSYHAEESFSVVGLERVPMALEALLQARQSELSLNESLPIGPPRRALSRMGRQLPDDVAVIVRDALMSMTREDDATAADLIGWRLGWKAVQARLPAFGLMHHTIMTPARARALAFTDLNGPLRGTTLEQRIELWRQCDEEERRHLIGQLHQHHLETPLETLAEAFLDVATSQAVPWALKARWALALGPRGCAVEYARLMAGLLRGAVLGPPHSEQAMAMLKPCVGDPLTGMVSGVEMTFGKMGQTFGALNAAGVIARLRGSEVAICVLTKQIETQDYDALVEQLRILTAQIYHHIMKL